MPNTIVVGAQWGDEGKGKIVDFLAEKASVVARYQGGANAGHTIKLGEKQYILHLIPSGIITGKKCVIGQGVVVDYIQLFNEIEELKTSGIYVGHENLSIDENAHLILPYHRLVDMISGGFVGTTGRGIGYAYEDKANRRRAVRIKDIFRSDVKQKIHDTVDHYNHYLDLICKKTGGREKVIAEVLVKQPALKRFFGHDFYLDPYVIYDDLMEKKMFIAQFVKYHEPKQLVHNAALSGSLLTEGAQGLMLDVDNGTYPFVTSSNTGIGGAINGLGVFVDYNYRVGIVKAYTTRVGEGPFPTEQLNLVGEELRKKGHEYGATTGRPRRCGWLDIVVLKTSILASGINYFALTKLDVLTGFENIKICVEYDELHNPVYITMPGWKEDITHATSLNDLPENCRKYIQKIESLLSVPIGIVSVGPRRDQTIVVKEII
jgi:adenylosuccinate synthase